MAGSIQVKLQFKRVLLESFKAVVALISAFFVLFAVIPLSAASSVLRTMATYGTTISTVLGVIGSCIPMLIISLLTYYIFAISNFRSAWLSLFFIVPVQTFWVYLSISTKFYEQRWSSGINFLTISIALIFIILNFRRSRRFNTG